MRQVLRNIFGPVNLDIPKHNPRYPLRASRRGAKEEKSNATKTLIGRHDEYDFLASWSTYPNACSDLNASTISDLIDDGLVLWGSDVVKRRDDAVFSLHRPKEEFHEDYIPLSEFDEEGVVVLEQGGTINHVREADFASNTGAVSEESAVEELV